VHGQLKRPIDRYTLPALQGIDKRAAQDELVAKPVLAEASPQVLFNK
jgi:hypothetical protein